MATELRQLGITESDVRGKKFGPSNVHDGHPAAQPKLTGDMRYQQGTYPKARTHHHGEIETIGDGVEAIHWFVDAPGVRDAKVSWHFVTAGDPANPAVFFIHGLPETWWAWHHQMAALSDEFYVVAIDTPGYGQSDKNLDRDWRYSAIAGDVARLIDKIGLDEFALVGHDRGAPVADHLLSFPGMQQRVVRYVRMQQSADEPHGAPVPPHRLFASKAAAVLARSVLFPVGLYTVSDYVSVKLDQATLDRLDYEFKYRGTADAMPMSFKTTSFPMELFDRHNYLFASMTMPVLFLQATKDPGQHAAEYENTPDFVTDGEVRFIDANHFVHLEEPELVSSVMREFLTR
ncbi:MAG: alpha/beta hydrolase [bacterium]|nr:alpha/beta hydrolase [bacterium]